MNNKSKISGSLGVAERLYNLSLLLSVGVFATGCNIANHYESAANVGGSRVELTPQFKQSDDAELMARLGKTPTAASVGKGTRVAKPATAAKVPTVSTQRREIKTALVARPVIHTSTNAFAPPSRPVSNAQGGEIRGKARAFNATYDKNINALELAFAKNDEYYRSVEQVGQTISARCRRILAETGISTTLLRSPTVSANVDTNENYGISASYDFVDLKRANLQEELALAQCYRVAVSVKLTQLLVTSTQSLTRAGFLAKANALRRARGQFRRIRGRVTAAVRDGSLTQLRATTLRQYMDQISTGEARARGEASRREVVDRILQRSFKDLDRQLVAAEGRIHDIQSRMRTVDAIKFKGQVSYGGATDIGIGDQSSLVSGGRDGELTGTVQISVRLGAFLKRRHQLEEVARSARQEQHFEENSGVLWRAGELARANGRVLKNLRLQRRDVLRALNEAKRLTRSSSAGLEEDLLMPRLRARIDVLALKANLAGLDATIADTIRIERKLKFKN